MTHSATHDPILRTRDLTDVAWPADAVFVADANLPTTILAALPNPVLVEAGERLKRLEAIEALGEAVLARRNTRPLTLVAVGGGSVGDAVGFLASILWRGVALWHVPTTMIAVVDSAHGGKTAVNLGAAKNQLGTFYPAERVIVAESILGDLPLEQRRQGFVEMLKVLWLNTPHALDTVDTLGVETLCFAPWNEVAHAFTDLVEVAVRAKMRIVEQDPDERRGIRTQLNLGHTMAHAFELLLGLSHGDAVAWGLLTAAVLSKRLGHLDPPRFARLFRQIYPLLVPLHAFELPSAEALTQTLSRDKKKVDGHLRSIVLKAEGQPLIVHVAPDDWVSAWHEAVALWRDAEVELRRVHPWPATIAVSASKSEANRLEILRAVRPGMTHLRAPSNAADVRLMRLGLQAIAEERDVEVGDGGTTFRFLAAYACLRPNPTTFRLSARLAQRPHDALFDALRRAGATVEASGTQVRVVPPAHFPTRVSVETSHSSQFASAIALLAARGEPLELALQGARVSEGYFALTCRWLEAAGVRVHDDGDTIRFEPTDVASARTLVAHPDASSLALWTTLRWLGADVTLPDPDPAQPDARYAECLQTLGDEADVSDMPDVVPVLAAGVACAGRSAKLIGGAHLRLKESDRVADVAALLRAAQVAVDEHPDGLTVRASRVASGQLDALHDHRLAFAALVLSLGAPQRLRSAWTVLKSYPEVWNDARMAGWSILPLPHDEA